MLMRDVEIKQAIDRKEIVIAPLNPDRLQGASYDLAVGGEALVSNSDEKIILGPGSSTSLHLEAGDFALVLTRESVKVATDIAGVIGMRSSLARRGLMLLAGMQIDPGFQGHLRFGLYNASPRKITLDYDDGICMIEFHRLAGPVERPQEPIPELLAGKIPESDRAYLRTLETTSLSELSRNMQSMSENVSALTRQMRWLTWFLVPTISGIFVALAAAIIISLWD